MRTGWKVAITVGVLALVGAGVIAGAALADGGAGSGSGSSTAVGQDSREAFDALLACATDAGLEEIVADLLAGDASLEAVTSAVGALGACQDEANALVEALQDDLAEPGDLLRQAVTETASCLDREGVTLSALADAILGDVARGDELEQAAESCLPDLSLLTR